MQITTTTSLFPLFHGMCSINKLDIEDKNGDEGLTNIFVVNEYPPSPPCDNKLVIKGCINN